MKQKRLLPLEKKAIHDEMQEILRARYAIYFAIRDNNFALASQEAKNVGMKKTIRTMFKNLALFLKSLLI